MMIYSPTDRPYGLLSNLAYTPFVHDGTLWKNASDFIYGSFFKPGVYRDQILSYTGSDQSKAFYRLIDDILYNASEQAFSDGIMQRLHSSPELRQRLLAYDRVEIPGFPGRERVYNKWLDHHHKVDKKVMAGIRYAVSLGDTFPDDVHHSNFTHLALEDVYVPDDDPALGMGRNLIPYLKHIEGYERDLRSYKKKILENLLNYLIQQYDPQIKQVAAVRIEQLSNMTSDQVTTLTERTYDAYLDGLLPPSVVPADRPRPYTFKVPPQAVLRLSPDNYDPLYINNDAPLVTPEGTFKSILQYMYYKMFQVLGVTMPDEDRQYYLEELYTKEYNKVLWERLDKIAEVALYTKFSSHPTLVTLLKLTGNDTLIWNDKSDNFLGVGGGFKGSNIVGRILQNIRANMEQGPSPGPHMKDDIYLMTWAEDRFRDVYNTLSSVKGYSLDLIRLLRIMYGIVEIPGVRQAIHPAYLYHRIQKILPDKPTFMFDLTWDLISQIVYVLLQLDPDVRVRLIAGAQMSLRNAKADADKATSIAFLQDVYDYHKDLMLPESNLAFAARVLIGTKVVTDPEDALAYANFRRMTYFAQVSQSYSVGA